jgi:hypothetical protein
MVKAHVVNALADLLSSRVKAEAWRINFYLRTVEQFKWQKREHDQFLSTLLAGPRLFLIGDDRSLSEL